MSSRAERHPSRVYFVESLKTGLIKIGYSAQLDGRLQTLKVEHRNLLLLAHMEGGRRQEAEIHSLFDSLRIKGEWFAPSPLLLEYIAANGEAQARYSRPIGTFKNEGVLAFGDKKYYRIHAVAELTGEDHWTIGFLLRWHQIPVTLVGSTRLLDESGLDQLRVAIVEHRSK